MKLREILLAGGNAFLVAYAADAAVSTLDVLLHVNFGIDLLAPLQAVLAGLVVVGALVGFAVLALTPLLPLSVFLLPVASALWFLMGAPPLLFWFELDPLRLVACAIQLAVATLAFLRVRQLAGGTRFTLPAEALPERLFSARHTALFLATLVLVVIPGMIVTVAISATARIEAHTSGFVVFDAQGVALEDRSYARGDEEIRLVGMMHIGDPGAYQGIFESFVQESTIVLAEGLTDERGLMRERMSYDGIAKVLGLEQQQYVTAYLGGDESDGAPRWPVVRNADLDTSDLSPETLEVLERIRVVWSSEDPLRAFFALVREAENDPEKWTGLMEDILDRRNEHLVAQIDASLGEFERIVVPWGALHLPEIEEAVRDRGFEQTTSQRHRLITWATLLAALSR